MLLVLAEVAQRTCEDVQLLSGINVLLVKKDL